MGSDIPAPAHAVHPPASWLVRTTSPLHCVVAFASGAALQHLFGLPLPQGAARDALHVAGTVLANAGLLLVVWSFTLFARRRTTILPGHAPSRLVCSGPYRWTRNPVYLGMLASYAGLALMYDLPWALLLLPAPVWILRRAIIPYEESRLHAHFGRDYARYREAVRRWL